MDKHCFSEHKDINPIQLKLREPSGSKTHVIWNDHFLEHKVPYWDQTPEGKQLQKRRLELGLTLRQCAYRICMTMTDLSSLESGRATTDIDGWIEIMRRIG